jgi:hypothetical protein
VGTFFSPIVENEFGNKVERRTFGRKGDGVTGGMENNFRMR